MSEHESSPMQLVDKVPVPYRCSIRGKPATRHYWKAVLECPRCGAKAAMPFNLYRKRNVVCIGKASR